VTREYESRRVRVEGRTPIKGHPRGMGFGHKPSPLHTWRLKSQHHENSSSTSTTTVLSVSCISTLCELHPPPSRLTSPIMSLGPGVLVSRGRLALVLPLSAQALLPRLALARSAPPCRPCPRRLGPQFAVGANLSKGHGRFLYSLHLRSRLPSQTCTRLPIVSTVIGSTPPLPLQVSSRCSVTATVHSLGWHPTALAALAVATVAPPGYAQSSYCSASVVDVNALVSCAMFTTPHAPLWWCSATSHGF